MSNGLLQWDVTMYKWQICQWIVIVWSSYLDKEIRLISQSFCVSARDEVGCHSEFSI